MPASVYKLVFKDPELKKLAHSDLEIGTYTTDTVKIVGSCLFYLVYPDTKKLQEVTFYVAKKDGSVLLSCATTLMLGLVQPCTRLEYLPSRASLITSSLDHSKKTKKDSVHRSKKEVSTQSTKQVVTVPDVKQLVPKLVASREQIFTKIPICFWGYWMLDWPPYHVHLDQSITPKKKPCRPIVMHLKETFQQEIDKMLKAGVLKPVHKATHWINSFVLVDEKDKLGNLKLRICLDHTNLNKAIVREPYHFKTLGDIAHLLADACIMSVCDCKKGYWHQELDETSSFLTTFNTELGGFRYTVMPFGVTVAGDVFQHKLDLCFGHLRNV